MAKTTTAAIAREILRRENGYEPDKNINLADYGYDENTSSQTALNHAAQLEKKTDIGSAIAGNAAKDDNSVVYSDKKNQFANQIFENQNQYYQNVDSMKKPEYSSNYDEKINSLVDSILNGEKFSYDVNADSLFQNYADIYERNARLAAENTLGNAMAASGGYGNSYAAAVADQAYNNQMQGLNEIVPELQQLAYALYENEKNDKYNQLNLLNNMENQDYAKHRDEVSDYYSDINTQLGLGDRYNSDLVEKFNVANQLENEEYNREYQENRDNIADEQWNKQFEYNKELDSYERMLNEALISAESGNFDMLGEVLGVDMTEAKKWYQAQKGMELYSATGVVDYLKNAGIDTSVIEKNMKDEDYRNSLSVAMAVYEATGSSELLKNLGIDTSYMDEIMKYTLMSKKNSANGSSGGSGGESSRNNIIANDRADEDASTIDVPIEEMSDQAALDLLSGTGSALLKFRELLKSGLMN